MTDAPFDTLLETSLAFNQADLTAAVVDTLDAQSLDKLVFGVIGIDSDAVVRRYNSRESQMAGLAPARVLGHPLFTVVAPCMNNFLVAQRFEDAENSGEPLDVTVDYVLTLRMRPVKVKLRLLATPGCVHRYVLVQRP